MSLDRFERIAYSRSVSEPSNTGRLIAYWRGLRGISRATLAEMIGVTRPAVIQWETGKTAPTDANVRAVASAFGLDMAAFYAAERRLSDTSAA